jgi:hypothetical protein
LISRAEIESCFDQLVKMTAASCDLGTMLAILYSAGMFIVDLFKPQCRLEAENLFLRQQLSIALRRAPSRLRLRGSDRALLSLLRFLG